MLPNIKLKVLNKTEAVNPSRHNKNNNWWTQPPKATE